MKKIVPVLVIIAMLTGLFAVAGCGGEDEGVKLLPLYVGKYVSKSDPADFIELDPNSTFIWAKAGDKTMGSYAVESGKVLLSAGSLNTEMSIGKNTLTDSGGIVYYKQP